jgi:hypothetical protein
MESRPCKKGADSIRSGIDNIKSYGAVNLVSNELWKQEQQKYVWKVDRKDGKALNKPLDRYGVQGIRKNTNNLVYYGK